MDPDLILREARRLDDDCEFEAAREHYEAGGKSYFYAGLKALDRAAELAAKMENYDKAIELYQIVSFLYESSFIKAGICALANQNPEQAIELSRNPRCPVEDSKTLKQLVNAVETPNHELFCRTASEYDLQCNGISEPFITVLLRIKNRIPRPDLDF